MGCDIHAYIEVKINNKWCFYNRLDIQRNYEIFGYLAGVRLPDLQNFNVKGLPEDMDFITQKENEHWNRDGHTHSYLGYDDLVEFQTYHDDYYGEDLFKNKKYAQLGYLYGNTYDFKKFPEDYPEWVEDVRMIFWFDN